MPPISDAHTRLREAGIALEPAHEGDPAPEWYIAVLQGLGGWMAALFLLGFLGLGLLNQWENTAVWFFIGSLLTGCAYGCVRVSKGAFAEQLALAFSLSGQTLVAFAIGRWLNDFSAMFWLCLFALNLLLTVIMATGLLRVIFTALAAMSLFFAGAKAGLIYLVAPLTLAASTALWLNEFRLPFRREVGKAVAMGLVLALLVMQYLLRFPELLQDSMAQPLFPHWLGEWLLGATLGSLWLWVIKKHQVQLSKPAWAAGAASLVLLCLASSLAYGLTQGAALLALGFAVGHRLLAGLGMVSLLFSVSTYYYRLDLTLLEKSATLLALGLLLLGLREGLRRWPTLKEKHHA